MTVHETRYCGLVGALQEPWETDRLEEFRTRFGEDPDAYDRTRPVAPGPVFEDILRFARWNPGSSVVEIGPGTGQATLPLAERRLNVLSLEIDARLADRAAQNLAAFPDASVRATSFEDWDPGDETFDGLFACNSFHWIEPALRFVKSAAVLRRDGRLVVMSTPVVVPDGADRFWWDVQDDWAAVGADRVDPAIKHPDLVEDLGFEVRASGLFEDPIAMRHRFDVAMTAAEYVANLSTQSGLKELPPDAQRALLQRVRERIEAQGGTLTVHHLAVITVAKPHG